MLEDKLMMTLRYTSAALGLLTFGLIGLTPAGRTAETADGPQPGHDDGGAELPVFLVPHRGERCAAPPDTPHRSEGVQ